MALTTIRNPGGSTATGVDRTENATFAKEVTAAAGDIWLRQISSGVGQLICDYATSNQAIVGGSQAFYINDMTTSPSHSNLTIDYDGTINCLGSGIDLDDNNKIRFGTGNDFSIYHDGTHTLMENSTGTLQLGASQVNLLNAARSEYTGKFIADGAVELYYDSVKKFETTTDGVTVTGAATFSDDVVAGSDPYVSTSNVGIRLDSGAGFVSARSSGTNQLWVGQATGSGDVTSQINAAGLATFANNVTSGTDWNSGDGVTAEAGGQLYIRNDSESGVVFAIQNGGNGTGGDRKASITGAGAAKFSSYLDVTGNIYTGSRYTNGVGSLLSNFGSLVLRCDDGSDYISCWTGGNDAANRKVRITNAGVATFSGNVTSGASGAGNVTAYGKVAATNLGGSDNTDTKFEVVDNGGEIKAKILANGNATFAGPVKIGGTAAANEMDEYEEGTWTPALSFTGQSGSFTYSSIAGTYTKVGRMVTVSIMANCSAIPTAGTDLCVSLPIAPIDSLANTTADDIGAMITYFMPTASASYAIATNGTSNAMLLEQGADVSGGYEGLDYNDIAYNFSFRATLSYCA